MWGNGNGGRRMVHVSGVLVQQLSTGSLAGGMHQAVLLQSPAAIDCAFTLCQHVKHLLHLVSHGAAAVRSYGSSNLPAARFRSDSLAKHTLSSTQLLPDAANLLQPHEFRIRAELTHPLERARWL